MYLFYINCELQEQNLCPASVLKITSSGGGGGGVYMQLSLLAPGTLTPPNLLKPTLLLIATLKGGGIHILVACHK